MLSSFASIHNSFADMSGNLPDSAQVVILLLSCLIPTIIIETLFALVFRVKGKNLLIVILAQVITNPIVALSTNLYTLAVSYYNNFPHAMIVMELFAFLAEAFIYKAFLKDYKFLNPFLLSFLLNLFSLIFGYVMLLLTYIF